MERVKRLHGIQQHGQNPRSPPRLHAPYVHLRACCQSASACPCSVAMHVFVTVATPPTRTARSSLCSVGTVHNQARGNRACQLMLLLRHVRRKQMQNRGGTGIGLRTVKALHKRCGCCAPCACWAWAPRACLVPWRCSEGRGRGGKGGRRKRRREWTSRDETPQAALPLLRLGPPLASGQDEECGKETGDTLPRW